jgi:hypothetical protein
VLGGRALERAQGLGSPDPAEAADRGPPQRRGTAGERFRERRDRVAAPGLPSAIAAAAISGSGFSSSAIRRARTGPLAETPAARIATTRSRAAPPSASRRSHVGGASTIPRRSSSTSSATRTPIEVVGSSSTACSAGPARGLFPSSCVDLTECALSDPTRERSSISRSTLAARPGAPPSDPARIEGVTFSP